MQCCLTCDRHVDVVVNPPGLISRTQWEYVCEMKGNAEAATCNLIDGNCPTFPYFHSLKTTHILYIPLHMVRFQNSYRQLCKMFRYIKNKPATDAPGTIIFTLFLLKVNICFTLDHQLHKTLFS